MIRLLQISISTFFVSSLFLVGNTFAQSDSEPPDNSTIVEKHQDWAVQCENNGQESLDSCFMFQRILIKDSGESLLRMTVDKPKGLSAPRAIFVIPLGTYVLSGILVKIDSNDPMNLEIEYCDKNGCYAGILLENPVLNHLKQGRKAMVTFQNRARQKISLPISLNGFTSGLAALN